MCHWVSVNSRLAVALGRGKSSETLFCIRIYETTLVQMDQLLHPLFGFICLKVVLFTLSSPFLGESCAHFWSLKSALVLSLCDGTFGVCLCLYIYKLLNPLKQRLGLNSVLALVLDVLSIHCTNAVYTGFLRSGNLSGPDYIWTVFIIPSRAKQAQLHSVWTLQAKRKFRNKGFLQRSSLSLNVCVKISTVVAFFANVI